MAFAFSTSFGGSFVSSVVSDEVYDPVFDTPMDAKFIWNLLPSFYRDIMEDKDLFETVWSGFLQQSAGDLLRLWHADYASNLRDVPVISQRKWGYVDLTRAVDFTVDPEFSRSGLGSADYTYSDESLVCTWTARARLDKSYLPLRGRVGEQASLAFSVIVNLSSIDTRGAALFGYLGDSDRQVNALVAGVIGDTASTNTPRPCIIHFSPIGQPTVSASSFVLDLAKDYRFDFSYTAGTGVAVLEVVELEYQKTTGTLGTTSGELEDVLTSQFEDSSVNFDSLGIVAGDTLIAFGTEYEIISVDGSMLTIATINLPVDTQDISYEIRGEYVVTSVSLDLPGDAANPSFVCSQFGTCNLDLRYATSQIYANPGLANRRTAVGSLRDWVFLDPTFEDRVITIPRLQDLITDPTLILSEGTDYEIVDSTIHFQEPPASGLWAEYIGYDEYYIQDNFGRNVGLLGESTDQYRARVRGLYYAYFQGPTVSSIRRGVHILVGLPIADKAGTVEAINPAYSGVLGLITVAGLDYLYPAAVGTSLSVGDEVALYEPLCEGVEIADYLLEPEWFVLYSKPELRKYHTFAVRLNLDAFSPDTIGLAQQFVDRIKPTWKDSVFVAFKELEDDYNPTDDVALLVVLNLADTPCDEFTVTYDGIDYEGEEVDWKYDQGDVDWEETSAAMRATASTLTGILVMTNASTAVLGAATLFTSEVSGGDNILVGLYRTDNSGETTMGSNVLTDAVPGVFDDVVVGDRMEITGEGTFEVIAVDAPGGQVTLDAPMANTASGVVWQNFGKLELWGGVSSVTDDTNLVLGTAFQGASDSYWFALMNEDYRNVFYDQFQEACPDEEFTLVITYTGVGPPPTVPPTGPIQVPDADPTMTTTYNFTFVGDSYTVTLDEPVP